MVKERLVAHAGTWSSGCDYAFVDSFRSGLPKTLIENSMTSTDRSKKSYVPWFKDEEILLQRLRTQNPDTTLLALTEIFNENTDPSRKRSLDSITMKLKQIKRSLNAATIRPECLKEDQQTKRAETTASFWMQESLYDECNASHSLPSRREATAYALEFLSYLFWSMSHPVKQRWV